jgi:vacuolar protein sorting-associated protein 13B
LRLNVVEELANIPIKFKSGLIHELRLHIPWTRITSEPVVVTINTLEFVAKLKNQDSSTPQAANTTCNSSFGSQNASAEESLLKKQQQQQPQMPTGYIQNIITKILFNIQLIVNNVIIKFVEEDMVLSFNMKSAECFSVNSKWEKVFISEINNSKDFHLRKILQLNDVTICLDKLESKSNSKINFYQDPLIYRFSIESRIDIHYTPVKNNNNLNPTNNFNQQLKTLKFNFYCRKFDISITDQQFPMVIRLIELIIAILNGNLKLPKADNSLQFSESPLKELNTNISFSKPMENSNEKQIENKKNQEELLTDVQEKSFTENQDTLEEQQGWISWAWSYVPNILPLNESEASDAQNEKPKQIEVFIGFYVDQIVANFKVRLMLPTSKSITFCYAY